VLLAAMAAGTLAQVAQASWTWPWKRHHGRAHMGYPISAHDEGDWAGSWYWLRSPEQEERVMASLYNLHCVRCHATSGRGVWDIPDVPDLTNVAWQDSRSDDQFARIILEGRGAVMPAFRGTLTLEEAWAMARYLRRFKKGSDVARPDFGTPDESAKSKDKEKPMPKQP
jgi:mono/diheme cytochrome c family protein